MTVASPALLTPSLDRARERRLHFTETWEDPRCDARALQLVAGDDLLTITAGGCTALSLLTEVPVTATSIDYNPVQTHLLELKVAALRTFSSTEVERFLRVGENAPSLYAAVREALSPAAREFWDSALPSTPWGLASTGVGTRTFYEIGRRLRKLYPREIFDEIFACRTVDEQRACFEKRFPHRTLRLVTGLLGPLLSNAWGRRLLFPADYFPHATERNIPAYLWGRIEHGLTEIPVRDNYFLSRILFEEELGVEAGRPPYLLDARLATLRENLARLQLVSSPIELHLRRLERDSLDKFQLSNVFEWMPAELVPAVFREIIRTARPGARVVFRNLFTDRTIPACLEDQLRVDTALSEELWKSDRSFIYSRCCVATVCK